jgi:hypothetical protein
VAAREGVAGGIRRTAWLLGSLLLCPVVAPAQDRDTAALSVPPDLAARADSLGRLEPARELAAALARGDWRFIGVAGYVVVASGVGLRDPCYPRQLDAIRVVEGTSDTPVGPAGARLQRVATAYAERYNGLLLERLRRSGRC